MVCCNGIESHIKFRVCKAYTFDKHKYTLLISDSNERNGQQQPSKWIVTISQKGLFIIVNSWYLLNSLGMIAYTNVRW